jgi:hypothetical protein
MDDPTRRCENDTGNETRLPGLPIPSGGPTFFVYALLHYHPRSLTPVRQEFLIPRHRHSLRKACSEEFVAARLIDPAGHRDARMTQHVGHLCLAQA